MSKYISNFNLKYLAMFSTLSTFEFQRQFTDVNNCLSYLAETNGKMATNAVSVAVNSTPKAIILLPEDAEAAVTTNQLRQTRYFTILSLIC